MRVQGSLMCCIAFSKLLNWFLGMHTCANYGVSWFGSPAVFLPVTFLAATSLYMTFPRPSVAPSTPLPRCAASDRSLTTCSNVGMQVNYHPPCAPTAPPVATKQCPHVSPPCRLYFSTDALSTHAHRVHVPVLSTHSHRVHVPVLRPLRLHTHVFLHVCSYA